MGFAAEAGKLIGRCADEVLEISPEHMAGCLCLWCEAKQELYRLSQAFDALQEEIDRSPRRGRATA